MAIRFQYNKISLQSLGKQLKIRTQALPILKNKESALRIEVKNAKSIAEGFQSQFSATLTRYGEGVRLWAEFEPDLLKVKEIKVGTIKIAGIKIPEFEDISFKIKPLNLFGSPAWYPEGIIILRELYTIIAKKDLALRKMELLNMARKKTTQKVNLYEKVQIPGYEDAIRRIKSFLEDEENLQKSSQKIIKSRQAEQSEVEESIAEW
ncbi:MAG: V-type ATP synthase subunit D [Bacteroidales bacterium]|nr:V-type ATP synthase subunit D [Bacteroidales bacterium]